jgi:peroxiredoxin Q/BCP
MDPELLALELPNVGEGPNPISLGDLVSEAEYLVLLLMQSHRSGTCRQQAREVAEHYDEFRALNARAVAIVPGSLPQIRSWRRLVEPPFPVVADDDTVFGKAFHQPQRYGLVGRLVDSFGRMPVTVVLECHGADVSVRHVYEGDSSLDRPSAQDVLDVIRNSSA